MKRHPCGLFFAYTVISMASNRFSASRRATLKALLLQSVGSVLPRSSRGADAAPIRIGLTPVFLDNQIGFLAQWRQWLENTLGERVRFVQRGSYREMVELVRTGQIDFAWICGYPFTRYRNDLRLVAVPLWRGEPLYRSYIIVHRTQTNWQRLTDLHRTVFAYSDPDSNSGYLYPNYVLAQSGVTAATFFARTFFTWAHRKVIEAVSVGLAAGGAVDSYVWETLAELHPELVLQTKILERSPAFGFPPFVTHKNLPPEREHHFRTALLRMAKDRQGAQLLQQLRLDGFTHGDESLYDGIAWMAAYLNLPQK